VDSYSQATSRAVFDVQYKNYEFYLQDNWRVNKRLTLDVGVRFYHQTPQVDNNHTFSNFVPSFTAKRPRRVSISREPAPGSAWRSTLARSGGRGIVHRPLRSDSERRTMAPTLGVNGYRARRSARRR
jgi:outer membrane receptor protein involved in Fe transport